MPDENRRSFLKASTIAAVAELLPIPQTRECPGGERDGDTVGTTVRVVVWDGRQQEQKKAYEDFLGNRIAGHLRGQHRLSVHSVALDDSWPTPHASSGPGAPDGSSSRPH